MGKNAYMDSLTESMTGKTPWVNPHRIMFSDGSVLVDDGGVSLEQVIAKVAGYGFTVPDNLYGVQKVFFTADTHFGHKVVLEKRRFASVEEHDEWIVQQWNSVVPVDAIVVCLGDMTMESLKNLESLERLHGRKILVSGNHDRVWTRGKRPRAFNEYLRYFDAVVTKGSIVSDGLNAIVSHIPPVSTDHAGAGAVGYMKERPAPSKGGFPVLCGHVHDQWVFMGKCYNVGVDHSDGKPVEYSDAKEALDSIRKNPGMGAYSDLTEMELSVL